MTESERKNIYLTVFAERPKVRASVIRERFEATMARLRARQSLDNALNLNFQSDHGRRLAALETTVTLTPQVQHQDEGGPLTLLDAYPEPAGSDPNIRYRMKLRAILRNDSDSAPLTAMGRGL